MAVAIHFPVRSGRRRLWLPLGLLLGLSLLNLPAGAVETADPTEALAKAGWQAEKLPSGGVTYVCGAASCNGPAVMLFVSRPIGAETLAHLRASDKDLETAVRHELLGLDGDTAAKWPFLSLALKETADRIAIIIKGFYTGAEGNPSDSGRADVIILIDIHAGVAKAITSIAASPSAAAINLAVARSAFAVTEKPQP